MTSYPQSCSVTAVTTRDSVQPVVPVTGTLQEPGEIQQSDVVGGYIMVVTGRG